MDPDISIPSWLTPGRGVVHSTFGSGTVRQVGHYKQEPTVWIDFDYGERKALSLEYGLPRLSRLGRWSRKTRPDQALRCDVCGSRPLVVNSHEQMLCEHHRGNFVRKPGAAYGPRPAFGDFAVASSVGAPRSEPH